VKNTKFVLFGSEKCQLANLVANGDWLIMVALCNRADHYIFILFYGRPM